jgi:hypothetical protein
VSSTPGDPEDTSSWYLCAASSNNCTNKAHVLSYSHLPILDICKYNIYNWAIICRVRAMVFNATFNNISAISWRSVLLVEETRVPGENHRSVASHRQIQMLYRVHLAWARFKLTAFVVIGTDCIGSCISNYNIITTTTSPKNKHRYHQFKFISTQCWICDLW